MKPGIAWRLDCVLDGIYDRGAGASARGYGVYLAGATALWFLLVAWLFSRGRVRAGFARMGHWFDRLTGAVLIGLGVRLAVSEIG
jgi:threonine/homoserine/homoserine lactone efflux protein